MAKKYPHAYGWHLPVLVGVALVLGGCGGSQSMTCGDWREGSSEYKKRMSEDFADRNLDSNDPEAAADVAYSALDGTCEVNDLGLPADDEYKPHDEALDTVAALIE